MFFFLQIKPYLGRAKVGLSPLQDNNFILKNIGLLVCKRTSQGTRFQRKKTIIQSGHPSLRYKTKHDGLVWRRGVRLIYRFCVETVCPSLFFSIQLTICFQQSNFYPIGVIFSLQTPSATNSPVALSMVLFQIK